MDEILGHADLKKKPVISNIFMWCCLRRCINRFQFKVCEWNSKMKSFNFFSSSLHYYEI